MDQNTLRRCGAGLIACDPDATNAIFRAYRYTPDEVPWLSAT